MSAGTDVERELAPRLRLVIGRLARRLRQQNPVGLTPAQVSALASVEEHGPLRLGELAFRESVSPPTLTRCVAPLEAAGLLERRTDPTDRRSSRVALTPAGRRVLDQTREERTALLAERLRRLAADQLAALAAALPVLEALLTDL